MNEIECPYCGAENEVEHDGEYGTAEDQAHEMECDKCRKNFIFYTTIHFRYSPRKADCLNGAPHNYGEWKSMWYDGYGNNIQQRDCQDCDRYERRKVLKERMEL